MKKANVISVLLTVYLIVLAVLAFPTYQANGEWIRYVLIVTGQLLIIFLLRYFAIRRERMKRGRESDLSAKK
jgi:hypothetical protein